MIVGIIGQGTMGAGIAQVAAQYGCKVVAVETNVQVAEKAKTNLENTLSKLVEKQKISSADKLQILNNIQYSSDLTDCKVCDLVIEAIVENLDIKKKVFQQLEAVVSDSCVLATNTSSLSVTSIASACQNPGRFIGIHFFNPAPLMQLVEIIPAVQTSERTVAQSKTIIESWRKICVLAKDTPGFIVNRVARPYYSESIKIFEEGLANKETIDHALKTIGGFKMGPFELMDMIGHDVNYVVTETVWQQFFYDPRFKPSFTQKRLLEAAWLGKKTGRGFYDYAENAIREEINQDASLHQRVVDRVVALLINEAADACFMHIANEKDIETAMTKGVNYPQGLLAWANAIGIETCVQRLDELYNYYHDDRYRCCPLLRHMLTHKLQFKLHEN